MIVSHHLVQRCRGGCEILPAGSMNKLVRSVPFVLLSSALVFPELLLLVACAATSVFGMLRQRCTQVSWVDMRTAIYRS